MVERLPSVDRYLERLPRGLSSHPECQVKASVYRDALASHGLESVISELPRELRELVLEPPPVSSWVPEVYANSIMMAIRDVHFEPGTVGVTAYSEWTRQRNLLLLTRPLYRALFLLLSPERLLKGLQRRWGAFRRALPSSSFIKAWAPWSFAFATRRTCTRRRRSPACAARWWQRWRLLALAT